MAAAPNQPQSATPSSNRRTLTGIVTKLVGDEATYGFINDEIFFQQSSVISGGPAAVNDQVYAECEYSAHLPIKWNATSVKVLNKASASSNAPHPPSAALGQPQQHSMTQQAPLLPTSTSIVTSGTDTIGQQQSANVAVTYQQHRQQRLQRQMLEMQQQQQPLPQQQQHHHPHHSQQQDLGHQADQYFAPGMQQQEHHQQQQPQQMSQPPPQMQAPQMHQQQPDSNLPPFHDRPMGPPKFVFTNQLGSAFVQNPAQFIPSPFLAQQPPPQSLMQQQQPSHPPPQVGANVNNQQQRQKRDGNRFERSNDRHNSSNNSSSTDNNRQNNRRMNNNNNNNNRNEGSMNNRSSGDRDNRSRTNNSRDRTSSSGVKKDDTPTRASPPISTSRTSISSDRGSKSQKRHYEPTNIPRSRILTDMNSSDMKYRCSSSIHVPSDLKNVIINKHYRLDIKNTPKPVKYKIEQANVPVTKEEPASAQSSQSSLTDKKATSEAGSDTDQKPKSEQQSSSKSETIKLSHKYGVKVVLISLPELEDIYREVFGQQLDSFTNTEHKRQHCLDESISLLCSKGSSGGNSLIGGKFDPNDDGYIEGVSNEFERSGRQPDLIATCKRVVREQTGLDLSSCQSWTHISTFMYNNKSDYFSSKASIEYSYIYMPQIWTMAADKLDKKLDSKEEQVNVPVDEAQPIKTELDVPMEAEQEAATDEQQVDLMQSDPVPAIESDLNPIESSSTLADAGQAVESTTNTTVQLDADSLADLKVVELKAELDKRGIKYKPNAKKIELVTALRESLVSSAPDQEATEVQAATGEVPNVDEQEPQASATNDPLNEAIAVADTEAEKNSDPITGSIAQDVQQLEEGEVLASKEQSPEVGDEEMGDDAKTVTGESKPDNLPGGKRKISSQNDPLVTGKSADPTSKKAKLDSPKKSGKVELISEPFVVRPQGQQQLALVSLYDINQVSRYDQFELSVTSNIIKESLIQHFSEYILTALVEDNQQSSTTAPSQNLQETNGDTNNNSSSDTKAAFKNPSVTNVDSKSTPIVVKELPIDRYINLAFVYFDSTHIGYLHYDDLIKLFNNTGLNLSKRALLSLIGDNEKFNYRLLPDISPKLSPTYTYKFPKQFNTLPGDVAARRDSGESDSAVVSGAGRIEYEGVTYTIEKLINQVREAETMRVNYVNRFNQAIENYDKQAEEIHILEVSQKSLSKAIKAQNEEICDLKRERDSIKKKYEHLRKGIDGTVSSLRDLVKEEK